MPNRWPLLSLPGGATSTRIRGRKGQQIRSRHFAKHPLCVHCARRNIVRQAVEIDHIVPLHKGGLEHESNRQGLCVECHLAKTRVDLGLVEKGADVDGTPTDPTHHWSVA